MKQKDTTFQIYRQRDRKLESVWALLKRRNNYQSIKLSRKREEALLPQQNIIKYTHSPAASDELGTKFDGFML
jgi:hypothetical protein